MCEERDDGLSGSHYRLNGFQTNFVGTLNYFHAGPDH